MTDINLEDILNEDFGEEDFDIDHANIESLLNEAHDDSDFSDKSVSVHSEVVY